MLVLLRRTSVKLRLVVAFLAAALCLVAVAAIAVGTFRSTSAASVTSRTQATLAQQAITLKYAAADWNGWQTAYSLDANLDPASVDAATGSRASFVTSSATLDAALGELEAASGLTDAEQADVGSVRDAYDRFMTLDAEILAAYQAGDAAGVAHANDLVLGDEIAVYQQMSASLQSLSDDLEARADAASAAATDAAQTGGTTVLVISAVALALLGLLLPLLVTSVVRPVTQLEHRLRDIAEGEGDLTLRLDVQGNDELSRTAASFNTFVEQIATVIRAVSGSAASVAAAAVQMSGTAEQIGGSAEETSVQAGLVAAAAEQVSRSVQTVATGTDEMGHAIREIAENASQAAEVAAEAVLVTRTTNATVAKLGESSKEIGAVVKAITQIAEQTNLLALNATIEAARAGEAGKGFAVVAGEVKELAQETARATEDISHRVQAIQADTDGAVVAIARIAEIVGRINDYQMTISSAVEEQTATTNEMNRNVTEAASGTSDIASNVTHVADAASLTTEGVAQTRAAVDELARMSSVLEAQVSRFRY